MDIGSNNNANSKTSGLLAHLKGVHYEEIIMEEKEFVDEDFPASVQSLINEKSNLSAAMTNDWKQIVWRRASQMFDG